MESVLHFRYALFVRTAPRGACRRGRGQVARTRINGEDKKTEMVMLRVTKAEKAQLVQEAKGKCTVSELIHSKLFRGGLRNHDALKSIAALHDAGMSLRGLALHPAVSRLELQALFAIIREIILKLARQLP